MRGVGTLVALLADARERLLVVLDGEHPEPARHTGLELDVLDAARGLVADVVVVRGLTADHGADAGDALVVPGLGADLGRHRQLEAARHLDHVDLVPGLLEDLASTLDQLGGELLVERGRRNRVAVSHRAGRARNRTAQRSRGRAGARPGSSPRRAPGPGGAAGAPSGSSWPGGTRGCARSARARSGSGR